jgi:hypothetical protein
VYAVRVRAPRGFTDALSPYRDACSRCQELEIEVRRLRGDDVEILPFTPNTYDRNGLTSWTTTRCPRCTTPDCHFRKVSGRPDTRICVGQIRSGFLWLKRCGLRIPHRHRRCHNCGHVWAEHANPPDGPPTGV